MGDIMRKVNLHFRFSTSQFIKEVRELSFESRDIDMKEYYNAGDPYVFEGDLRGLWVLGDLEVVVNCRGIAGFEWALDVKIGNKKLTQESIKGRINERGISVHNNRYPLP